MPASPVHTVIDPATGDAVSLHILARRHGLAYATIAKRYWRGKRGWSLVESHYDARSKAGTATQERLEKLRRRAHLERPHIVDTSAHHLMPAKQNAI